MIKLSERLMAIAGEIDSGQRVLDIGTDHGYLAIFLWENGICPNVIMSDISKGSLKKQKIIAADFIPTRNLTFALEAVLK